MLACVLIAAAYAAPQGSSTEPIPIVKDESQINGDGSYQYAYETGNGIVADQKGELKQVGDVQAISVQGEYSYPGENGETIHISYTADDQGFHPQGDHLPTAPPVPEAIARSLQYIASAPASTDAAAQPSQ